MSEQIDKLEAAVKASKKLGELYAKQTAAIENAKTKWAGKVNKFLDELDQEIATLAGITKPVKDAE